MRGIQIQLIISLSISCLSAIDHLRSSTADKGDVGLSDVVLFNPQSDASLSRIWPDCCPLQETQTRYRIVPPPVKKGPTDERGTDIAPKEDPKRFARLRRRLLG